MLSFPSGSVVAMTKLVFRVVLGNGCDSLARTSMLSYQFGYINPDFHNNAGSGVKASQWNDLTDHKECVPNATAVLLLVPAPRPPPAHTHICA